MKKNLISDAITDINPAYVEQASDYKPVAHKARHTRVLAIAVAAMVMVLMMGAGVIVANGGISGWFSERWEMTTGETITEEHLELVDSFSQALGLSETYEGVTVTVDSAAVSEDRIYLLLKVDGDLDSVVTDYFYSYLTSDSIGFTAGGSSFYGQDESGATRYLLDCHYDYIGEEGDDEMLCTLRVGDMNNNGDVDVIWMFEFTLIRNENSHISLTEDGEIITVTTEQRDYDTYYNPISVDVTVDITDIVLTEFGVSFICDNTTASVPYGTYTDLCDVHVYMNSGSEVQANLYIEEISDDESIVTMYYYWTVPVNLDEVASIRIGDTTIAVSQE
ncbi:MAG: DUF4179 domain-containing protein [Oscillospiraceae bacterium]|nr:DUF4179 domain-containing protein [Oscillospiraceae bacterium]